MVSVVTERLMSLKQAAELIGCSIQTVRKWADSGCDGRVLETIKFGRLVRTSMEAVERFQRPHITRHSFQTDDDQKEFLRVEAALAQRHG